MSQEEIIRQHAPTVWRPTGRAANRFPAHRDRSTQNLESEVELAALLVVAARETGEEVRRLYLVDASQAEVQVAIEPWRDMPELKAVREHRVYAVNEDFVPHASQRMVQTAELFAQRIHPELH